VSDDELTYAHVDGDRIGALLELLLTEGKLEEASRYSKTVSAAMQAVSRELLSHAGVTVHLLGGDDLVASWPAGAITIANLEEIRSTFTSLCTRTLSVGLGASVSEAVLSLRRAKLLGGNQIVRPIKEST
jgi:hypothetical protein